MVNGFFVVGKIFGSHHLKGAVKFVSNIRDLDNLVGERVVVTDEKDEDKIYILSEATNTM